MYNPKQLKYVEDKAFENYMYNNHFYSQVNNAVTPPIYDVTPVIVYDQKVARRNIIESFLWNPVQAMRSSRSAAASYGQYSNRNTQYGNHNVQPSGYSGYGGRGSRSNFTMGRGSQVSHLASEKPAASTKQCCDLLSGLSSEYPAEFPCAGKAPADWAANRAGKAIDIDTRNKIVNAIKNIDVYYDYVDKIKNTEDALANSNNSPSAELTLGINLSTYRTVKKTLENMFLEVLGFIPSTNERDNCVFDTNTFNYVNSLTTDSGDDGRLNTNKSLPKMTGGITYIKSKVPKFSENEVTQKILTTIMFIVLIVIFATVVILIAIYRRRIWRGLQQIADRIRHGVS